MTPLESAKLTMIRLVCGNVEIVPLAVAKIAKVGVSPELIVVVALAAGAARHWPVCGLVWQRARASGSVAVPVFAVAVMVLPAPMLSVATAKELLPVAEPMWRVPSLVAVATNAMMSGTGLAEDESNSVS